MNNHIDYISLNLFYYNSRYGAQVGEITFLRRRVEELTNSITDKDDYSRKVQVNLST